MKKILIPTDFSEVTQSALLAATEIARKTSAVVELLHIIKSPSHTGILTTGGMPEADSMDNLFVMKSAEAAEKKFVQIREDVRYVGVHFLTKVKVIREGDSLVKTIVNEPADLIIMGTEGDDGFLKGIFANSKTEKVAMKAGCMVLSVKKNLKEFRLKNVVLATNLEEEQKDFLIKLQQLQDIFDFTLNVVFVNSLLNPVKDAEKIESLKQQFLKNYSFYPVTVNIVNDLNEYSGITTFASNINADLIALSTHQHKGFHWLGGISEDLINFSEKPVLTYKID